ncbi:MAG: tRNA (adenosine(37)-N6)-threonylcarbamoyltransferase complex dimerization subunit type 1 TsaB [Anaerolineae bacterium]
MILAIDTATQSAGLAIFDPDREIILAEQTWHSRVNHTVELTPNLRAMLDTQHLTTSDLTGIVVARGPGSFTGLRIGMSVGKALAYAHGIEIAAVPTLDVIAHAQAARELPLWAILQAGRERIVAACYPVDGPPPSQEEYKNTTLPELADQIDYATLFSGELDAAGVTQLKQTLGELAVVVSPANRVRRPAHLAEAGWQALAAGRADDPVTLAPIYLHRPGS